jgi:hypothetical protein
MKIRHHVDYREARIKAYPTAGEQLDAQWKIIAALMDGKPAPADALAVKAAVDAVKRRHPKN